MRNAHRLHAAISGWLALVVIAFCMAWGGVAAAAETELEKLVSAVVKIKTHITPEGRTVEGLGREREGSGIVIDNDGLVLTIGYLMVEAYAAEITTNDGHTVSANVVGYDHETGFGLLRAVEPLKIKPLVLGKSSDVNEGDFAVVSSGGGPDMVLAVSIASKRVFAGNWEYLVDDALFTAPAHPAWSGAALINREGKLVGVGSLIVGDAKGTGDKTAGNMFVPAERLMPILGDLIADGRVSGPGRPWLGVNADEIHGRLMVSRVTPGGPAQKAGLRRGDIIVGVNGTNSTTLVDFYRKIWAQGGAGATIPLNVLQGHEVRRIDIPSINRLEMLKLKSTF
jgi:S1-C subfamily serine protease